MSLPRLLSERQLVGCMHRANGHDLLLDMHSTALIHAAVTVTILSFPSLSFFGFPSYFFNFASSCFSFPSSTFF